MKIHLLIGLFIICSANCDLLEENFFFHILENVVVPGIEKLNYISKIRFAVTLTNAAYESLSPYLNESIGIYSSIPRRPLNERTARNKNIAIAYASIHVISNLLPKESKSKLCDIFHSVGLDPTDQNHDITTPIGIGNTVAKTILKVREDDGFNQYGTLNGKAYNRIPYEDYTMFKPMNTPYELKWPTKWQPLIEQCSSSGEFVVQSYVYPQYALAKPISDIDVNSYTLPEPIANMDKYKEQVDDIIEASRNLDDYKKMVVEHFNDKIASLLQPVLFLANKYNFTQDDVIILDFITHIALFDAGIVIWKEKVKYNSARPITGVRYFYENKTFSAWGGPGVGIVNDITGKEWRSYSKSNAYAEYPSAISCFCAAQFAVLENYFKTQEFGYSLVKPAGSSLIEPNITPERSITLGPYETFDEYVDECGMSRIWGGVHFRHSVEEAKSLCKSIGVQVYNYAIKYISGN